MYAIFVWDWITGILYEYQFVRPALPSLLRTSTNYNDFPDLEDKVDVCESPVPVRLILSCHAIRND